MSSDPADLPLWLTPPPPGHTPDLTLVPTPPVRAQPLPRPVGPAQAPAPLSVDWALVRSLRARAATELASIGRGIDQGSAAVQIVADLVAAHAADAMSAGQPTWSRALQQATAQAVLDALLGLGRLEPLVNDPRVENIEVDGTREVVLVLADGSIQTTAPVADTDEELIELIQQIAANAPGGARPFSPAHPSVHLELPGGARMAAAAWITRRPAVVIRRHRFTDIGLDDLVASGSMDRAVADLLAAAVRARVSVVVSGPQGVGKTTLLRALAAEIDPWERIGTLETERELHLDETGRHHRLVEFEARPGSGERTVDGRMAGEITLGELTEGSFRFNLDRFFVGEVRGWEIVAMFQAMQGGAGSMSTTHAHDARAAIERLVTCAMEAGPTYTSAYAYRQVGAHIDLIIQLGMSDSGTSEAPQRTRHVVEVIAVEPGENDRPATTTLWRRHPRTGCGVPGVIPTPLLDRLLDAGFDSDWFHHAGGLR